MISDQQLKQLVEAALFAAEEPLGVEQLRQGVLAQFQLNRPRIRQVLDELQEDYQQRGIELVEVASGFRFQTRAELGDALRELWPDRTPKYSAAVLETLALIAWQQPVTRGDIEAVRGVSVSTQIMRTLQERGWVKVVGHKEVPGRPALYATTRAFLDYFSLQSVADLPAFQEFSEHLAEPPDETDPNRQQAGMSLTAANEAAADDTRERDNG